MGVKSKLTKPLCKEFCKAIESGASILAACGHVKISEQTYYNWWNKGKDAKRKSKFRDFYEAVEVAKNKALYNFEDRIVNEADNGTWTAAAWWLERRHPEIYGKKVKQEVEAKAEVKSDVTVNLLDRVKKKREELDELED